jgi:hypothetical protein
LTCPADNGDTCRVLAAIIAFLVFVALFTLLFRFTTRTVGNRVGRFVNARHRAAESILDSTQVPEDWVEEAVRKGRSGERARRFFLRRLRVLRRYFERSPLVDGEDTRRILLEALDEARDAWAQADPRELLQRRNEGAEKP